MKYTLLYRNVRVAAGVTWSMQQLRFKVLLLIEGVGTTLATIQLNFSFCRILGEPGFPEKRF